MSDELKQRIWTGAKTVVFATAVLVYWVWWADETTLCETGHAEHCLFAQRNRW
jgi:hypothetical protein